MKRPFEMSDREFTKYMDKEFEGIKHYLRSSTPERLPGTPPEPDYESDSYDFGFPNRGLALILNNDEFKDTSDNREGSSSNVFDMNHCLTEGLGFQVLVFDNLTFRQMIKVATEAAKSYKHEEADCFVCVIMSHGNQAVTGEKTIDHMVLGSDGTYGSTQKIIERFDDKNCASLMSKPRLFFIQACRGDKVDNGVVSKEVVVESQHSRGDSNSSVDGANSSTLPRPPIHMRSIPLYTDCLIMYASPPDYAANKRSDEGSWLLKSLFDFFNSEDVGEVSLLRGLTRVSNTVASIHEKGTGLNMPVIDTMLTKDIIMTKKGITRVLKKDT